MELECSCCKQVKSKDEFYKNKRQKSGYDSSKCKSCIKDRHAKRSAEIKSYRARYYRENAEEKKAYAKSKRDRSKSSMFTVYLLEKEMYVGQTNNLEYRLKQHSSMGRNISKVIELGVFNTRREALDAEAMYHRIGYKGKK